MGIQVLFRKDRKPLLRVEFFGLLPDEVIEAACRVLHNTRGDDKAKRQAMREFVQGYGGKVRFHLPKAA